MLDCTCQTNKYGLPLLNIIGASSLNETTQIGLAFISGEAEHDFDWIMRVLRKLFENHQIRPPRIIVTDRQLALINALKEMKHTTLIMRIPSTSCIVSTTVSTLTKSWPYKERLAKCYANRYRLFDEQCSSHCEGQHSCIKHYWLASSRYVVVVALFKRLKTARRPADLTPRQALFNNTSPKGS
jgi:MULE transposase domain